jgi:hypothetical protein
MNNKRKMKKKCIVEKWQFSRNGVGENWCPHAEE